MNYPDLTAPDAADTLLAEINILDGQIGPQFRALRDRLPPELLPDFMALWQLNQRAMQLQGARKAVRVLRHAERVASQTENLQRRVEGQARHIEALNATIARLKAEQPPTPPSPAPTPPAWDHKAPERRRPRRDEVVTESPFAVEVVARQVEEFVRRQGRCTKPDVSAAHPDLRPYLAVAYRHLHQSRRVRVDGWTLTPWS